jgi:hypothetical protein
MIVPILNPLRFYSPNGSKVKENNPFFLSQNYWNDLTGSYQPKFLEKLECIAYEEEISGVYGFTDVSQFTGIPIEPRIENCKFCYDSGNAVFTFGAASIGKVVVLKYSGDIDLSFRDGTTVIAAFTGSTDGVFIHTLTQNYTNLNLLIEANIPTCILGAMVIEPLLDYTTCEGEFEALPIDICSYGGVYLMQIEDEVSCCKITIGDYESEFFSIISEEDKEFLKLQKVSYLSYFMDKDMAFSDLWEAHILVESKLIFTKGSDKEIFEGQNRNIILDDKALRLRIFRSGAIPYYLAEQLDLIFGFNLNIDGVNYVAHEQTEIEEITGNTDLFNFECVLRAQDFDLDAANSLYSQAIIAFKNATLKVNGDTIKSLSSGEVWELKVEVDGVESGTFDGVDTWEISGGGGGFCEPATFEINGVEAGTAASGGNLEILVKQDGSQVGSLVGGEWIIPSCPTMMGAMPTQTGQTSTYALNDDGAIRFGRLVNFTTLPYNNGFGNTNRFTDTLGGQTYANNIVIDWSTWACGSDQVIGYCYSPFSNFTGTRNRTDWCLNAPYTCSGFSGFYLINENMRNTISNLSLSSGFNGAPFNIAVSGFTNRFYTSSTISNGNAIFQSHGDPLSLIASPTTAARAMLYRVFTWNGSSLT